MDFWDRRNSKCKCSEVVSGLDEEQQGASLAEGELKESRTESSERGGVQSEEESVRGWTVSDL